MTQVAALILLVFGWLPIANWIPGGHDAPWYAGRLSEWLSGGAIALGVGILAAMSVRRWPRLWREGGWTRIAARWRTHDRNADAFIALVSIAVCAVVAQTILSAKPLLIDEVIQLYQARIIAAGHFWLPAQKYTEFTSAMHLLDWDGKVYGQFPVGGPAMLALGVLLHAAWLVGPVATGIGVYLFARLLRRVEAEDGTALAAVLLYAFAPFTVFLGGSMMNHVTTTTWVLAAALALAWAVEDDRPHPRAALAMGLALGIAATIRPTDAAAFALPAAGWLLWRARAGGGHLAALLLSGVGVALPMAVMFYVNSQQTGHPFEFGYIAMWGKSHEIGFHAAPWGPAHTPARGLELINLYFLRLQDYLFEAVGPSLAFATLALALTRRVRAFDRWVLAASGLVVLGYFAYWHDGFYLGPRFFLPLAPWLAWWTARLPAVLRARRVVAPVVRGTVVAGATALLLGAATGIPIRAEQYRNGMLSMRFDIDRLAAESGVHNAVVLVRESWGGQMVARMWGLGVTRTDADHIYRTTDACRLEGAITATEKDHGDAAQLKQRLDPFRGDSARLITVTNLPDTTVRFLPGESLTPVCGRRITEDRAGFTLYTPFLVEHGSSNVFVRDLHALDSLAIAQHPGMPIWIVTEGNRLGSPLRFERVPLDSMRREWEQD
ncbi:MAG TPA: hypothetical protein VGM20_15235 [Gemmatimonadales bacterium]